MCVTLFQQRKRKLTCGTSNLPCPYSPSTPGCNLCQTQLLSPAWSTNIRHSLVLCGREQSGVGISWTERCFPSSFWQLTLGLNGCQGYSEPSYWARWGFNKERQCPHREIPPCLESARKDIDETIQTCKTKSLLCLSSPEHTAHPPPHPFSSRWMTVYKRSVQRLTHPSFPLDEPVSSSQFHVLRVQTSAQGCSLHPCHDFSLISHGIIATLVYPPPSQPNMGSLVCALRPSI